MAGKQPCPDEALSSLRNEQGHVLMVEFEADGLVWIPSMPAQLGPIRREGQGPGQRRLALPTLA